MKLVIMFLFSSVFSVFVFANYIGTEEVYFVDPSVEDLPPVEDMVGIIYDENGEEQAVRGEYGDDRSGEEIQLVNGECGRRHNGQRHHGHSGCGSNSPNIIINPPHVVIVPPVPPVPFVGNVCRDGGFYCYTNYPGPVGTYCTCYAFGVPWLQGRVSTW